jgi:pimeloyl-ACP methyl ester carboxylesterase
MVAFQFGVYWTPRLGERALGRFRKRYTPGQRVAGTIKLCFADATRADRDVLAAGVELVAHRDLESDPDLSFLVAARSLLAVLRHPRRYSAAIGRVTAPALLLHGEQDRLVPIAAARRAAVAQPAWQTAWLPGVGHTPQLEVPDQFVSIVGPWLAALPA